MHHKLINKLINKIPSRLNQGKQSYLFKTAFPREASFHPHPSTYTPQTYLLLSNTQLITYANNIRITATYRQQKRTYTSSYLTQTKFLVHSSPTVFFPQVRGRKLSDQIIFKKCTCSMLIHQKIVIYQNVKTMTDEQVSN